MRKGLFLSRNHGRISDTVDVDGLAAQYSDLAVVRVYDRLFGLAEQQDILNHVKQSELNAVVLAGHSTVHFEPAMQGGPLVDALLRNGINRNKIAIANIDEQVAMIHAGQKADATKKAGLLINAALAKVQYSHDIDTVPVLPQRAVLVIGTTVGAIVSAALLLDKNYHVYILEKGGFCRADSVKGLKFEAMLAKVKSNEKAEIFLNSDLAGVSGWCGEYTAQLSTQSSSVTITVGGVLLCVGDDTAWIAGLRPKMRLDTDENGFLTAPVGSGGMGKTKDPGIWFVPFKAGTDQLRSEAADAHSAVKGLAAILNQAKIEHPVLVSEVDESLCGGCGTCVKICAFSASSIDVNHKTSVIDLKRCVGCGNCVTSCPTGARDLIAYPVLYMNNAIDILSKGVTDQGEPKVLAFLCKNSGYLAADEAGDPANHLSGGNYSPNIMPLRIECAGNIDTLYILNAFKKGFDGVALVVCKDGHCHNMVGNTDMERRLGLLRAVLRSRNIDDNRMRIIHATRREGKLLNAELNAFSRELKELDDK